MPFSLVWSFPTVWYSLRGAPRKKWIIRRWCWCVWELHWSTSRRPGAERSAPSQVQRIPWQPKTRIPEEAKEGQAAEGSSTTTPWLVEQALQMAISFGMYICTYNCHSYSIYCIECISSIKLNKLLFLWTWKGIAKARSRRINWTRPEADKQLVHQPAETSLEAIRGHAICRDGRRAPTLLHGQWNRQPFRIRLRSDTSLKELTQFLSYMFARRQSWIWTEKQSVLWKKPN